MGIKEKVYCVICTVISIVMSIYTIQAGVDIVIGVINNVASVIYNNGYTEEIIRLALTEYGVVVVVVTVMCTIVTALCIVSGTIFVRNIITSVKDKEDELQDEDDDLPENRRLKRFRVYNLKDGTEKTIDTWI